MPKKTLSRNVRGKLPSVFNEAQRRLISGKTPKKYIKKRVGVGNRVFDYVEIGYVIDQLNKLTGFKWSFRIVDQQIGKDQVWVKGRLTIYTPDEKIIKEQYGSKVIAKYRETGKIIDIGADLKSAASDSLKKCASLLGIAQDVYWKQEIDETTFDVVNPPQNGSGEAREYKKTMVASEKQRKLIFSLAKQQNIGAEEIKNKIKERFGLKSFTELTKSQASEIIEILLREQH